MYFHFTILKMKPEIIRPTITATFADANYQKLMHAAKGFRYQYALLSEDQPDEMTSISVWDSKEDATALFSNPEYLAMLGNMRDKFTAPPQRRFFDIIGELPGK
jgi:heme-degrading monooxygenase HmoA